MGRTRVVCRGEVLTAGGVEGRTVESGEDGGGGVCCAGRTAGGDFYTRRTLGGVEGRTAGGKPGGGGSFASFIAPLPVIVVGVFTPLFI